MPLDYSKLDAYISQNVVKPFYEHRIKKLLGYDLKNNILSRKNPYLFKAKNITTSETFVRSALDAFISSQEETKFGELLEGLAIYICSQIYDGRKAPQGVMPSVDLLFTKNEIFYIVGIKSGPNWGNSGQQTIMKRDFKKVKQGLRESGVTTPIVAVNGCIYGKDRKPFKKHASDPEMNFYKYCGQDFWEFISGDSDLYVTIIHPLDIEAKQRGPEFQNVYDSRLNDMSLEFGKEFLLNGQIDWVKLIEFVSKNNGGSTPVIIQDSEPEE
jgi:site-specific DNA-methyltransferase (cytosine-N4-specific)